MAPSRPEVEGGAARFVVKRSPIHGLGVFAVERIPAGATISTLSGEPRRYFLFAPELLVERGFEVAKDTYVIPDEGAPAWYFNHSSESNCRYSIERRRIEALRDISPGEEITIDYHDTTTWEGYAALWKGDVPP